MNESNPFQNSSVLVNDITLFKVQLGICLGAWLLHERLIQVHWVENVVFKFKESVHRSSQKLWVTESVGDELVLFLRFHFDIVLVAFRVKVFGDGSVGSFLFPLLDVLEVVFFVPGSVGNKSVFVGENDFLVIDVQSIKAKFFKFGLDGTVFVKVGIDTPDASLVGSVKITDGLPHFALHFQVVLEIFNYLVIFLDFDFIVVLVQLRMYVLRGVGVLVREPWVSFVLDFGVGFEFAQIIELLLWSHKSEAFIGGEPEKGLVNPVLQHGFKVIIV